VSDLSCLKRSQRTVQLRTLDNTEPAADGGVRERDHPRHRPSAPPTRGGVKPATARRTPTVSRSPGPHTRSVCATRRPPTRAICWCPRQGSMPPAG